MSRKHGKTYHYRREGRSGRHRYEGYSTSTPPGGGGCLVFIAALIGSLTTIVGCILVILRA